jgi:hypothetical protein
MTDTISLLEPSFIDLITAIEQSAELSVERRRHWVCSLRQIAKWLDRPAALIPARWSPLQIAVSQLHHARLQVRPKTLANHKANVRAALRWFGMEHPTPQWGEPLSPDWARFRDALESPMQGRLSSLMRYCSASSIAPASVERSSTHIGATAPRLLRWQQTPPRAGLWPGHGMLVSLL